MSEIRLFAPDDTDWAVESDVCVLDRGSNPDEPADVISFSSPARYTRPTSMMELLARSRTLHRNRQCRHCERAAVEPIHREDALLNRSQLPIPGTATLVGFRCQCCRREWRA